MNMSRVISALKLSLNLYAITLPFKDETTGKPIPTENILSNILSTITIPEYSQFQPWIRNGDCHVDNLKVIDKSRRVYMLPPFLTMTPVMYVASVTPAYNATGAYGDIPYGYGMDLSPTGVITANAYLMMTSQMRAEPTFEYLGENKIRLYGYPRTILSFEVACEHLDNGETIPDGCYDSFMELAKLDVKSFLYNNLKMYDNIASAFGNINLKIEDYQSADSDRTSLLNEWRDKYHVDRTEWLNFM
jgi:hypothetical protein